MSFVNSNYESKLSPTITENWLVQIFKNNNSSYQTGDTPDLAFSFSETTYNNVSYYPAILNRPTISYSLDLKSFTTKTGNVNLNIANIDIDGTTLLETLSNLYINAHVNILSQIDNDNTLNNALQIFSGKISSFGYKSNTIIINLISNRPFQNVVLPQAKTKGNLEGVTIPYVLGDYTQSSFNNLSKQLNDLYKVPYIRNDNDNLVFLLPNKIANNTSSINALEFYDKNIQKFIPLNKTGFASTTTSKLLDTSHTDGGTTVEVNSQIVKDFQVVPNDLTNANNDELTMYSETAFESPLFSNPKNAFDISTTDGTINDTTFATISGTINPDQGDSNESAGASIFLKFPKPMHKLTNFTLRVRYSVDLGNANQNQFSQSGFKFYMHSDDLSSSTNLADETNAGFLKGAEGGGVSNRHTSNVSLNTQTINLDQTKFDDIFKDNQIQDRLRLTFRLFAEEDQNNEFDSFTATLKIYSISATYTTALTTSDEPIAKQESNANITELYLSEPITTSDFNGHSGINNDLNNPVAIHRQIIKDFANINSSSGDTDNLNNGYKSVAELRDSTETSPTKHWKTRLQLYKPMSLERIMNKLQYEGCFFFQYSPQAQQANVSGTSTLRYFTIEDSVNANVDLSQNDISDYELNITSSDDFETSLVVNYKPHPAESKYEKTFTFPATFSGSAHETIFGNQDINKQEINLDLLYDAVDFDSGGSRNTSWLNFREKLFGDYKTIVNATLVNPEKYAMLQIGDYIDFGEILFSELGSPFDEISDTFDSFVAMPTRLFSEAWSGKKFIITNLKRKIGQVNVQCREV
ncbi:MAG: hypothetical protein VW904_03110 [bacterium]